MYSAANESCFTNHALDQFLEHLLPITERIVRMGSMSKSEKLEKYNLHEWINGQEDGTKTRTERSEEYAIHKELENQQKEGNEICEPLCHGSDKIHWDQLSGLLRWQYPRHYTQFIDGTDIDGFGRLGKKRGNFFKYWKFCSDLKDREIYESIYESTPNSKRRITISRPLARLLRDDADIWEFSQVERAFVLGHWEKELRQGWMDVLVERGEGYRKELSRLETLRSEYNRRLLERVDVIGLTTTGLARYASLVGRVESKTLICEEAGEVLEVVHY